MAAKTQPWFRLYSEVLSDRKIVRVVASSGQPKALIVGVWVTLLSLANDSPQRGYLLIADDMPLTSDEIIAEAGLPPELGSAILKAFIAANMLRLEGDCFVVAHWDERQFVSDTSAERVRRYREQKKGQQVPTPESPLINEPVIVDDEYANVKRYSNVTETPPESESESESIPNGIGDKSPPVKPKKVKGLTIVIPESVRVYQEIAKRLPDKALWLEIETKVGATPENLERWGMTITAYIGCGWNKLNLSGMLNFFEENRIPSTQPQKASANGIHPANKSSPLSASQREALKQQQAQDAKEIHIPGS